MPYPRDKFALLFDLLSPVYDHLIAILCRIRGGRSHEVRMRGAIVAKLDLSERHRLLEIGIGTGVNLEYLRPLPHSVTGVDTSTGMLKQCARRLNRLGIAAELYCHSAEQLSFDDNAFDRILCVNVLMYLQSPETALREMVRVLAPSGKLVLVVHSRWLESHRNLLSWLVPQDFSLKETQQGLITIIVVEKFIRAE